MINTIRFSDARSLQNIHIITQPTKIDLVTVYTVKPVILAIKEEEVASFMKATSQKRGRPTAYTVGGC